MIPWDILDAVTHSDDQPGRDSADDTSSRTYPGELQEAVLGWQWYHTMELASGLVTPGWFDTRSVAPKLPIPLSLAGMRCLDVGTFDGFWAFEMERRGGTVLAIDVVDPAKGDWPIGSEQAVVADIAKRMKEGNGFEIARRALGSKVERQLISVYDLDPSNVGTFDFIYVGSLLLHLRDPVRAVERVRSVCTGNALFVDAVDLELSIRMPGRAIAELDGIGRPWWWRPSIRGLEQMVKVGGFDQTQATQRLLMPPGEGQPLARLRPKLLLSPQGRIAAVTRLGGDPHAAILARPRI